jgi:hypothetical protein
MPRLTALTVWGAVLVGAAGAVVVLHDRGSEDAFRYQQSRLLTSTYLAAVTAAEVAAVVSKAPEPVPAAARTHPAQVRCRPSAGGMFRNPWSCVIRYRSGRLAHYRVIVQPDGHYTGVGTGIITGCCVRTPTLD